MTISTITLDWSSRDGDSACFKRFVEFGKKLNLTSKDVFFKMLVGDAINNAIEINYIVHFLALRGSLFNGTELNTDLILRNICRLRIYTCSKIKLNNSPAPISFGNTLHVDSGDTYSMEENTILKNPLKAKRQIKNIKQCGVVTLNKTGGSCCQNLRKKTKHTAHH